MRDSCARCGRPRYPDSWRCCSTCTPFRSDRFEDDDPMLPLTNDAGVAGGQGRHPDDVTDAAMALRDLALMLAGGVSALLLGWMAFKAWGAFA